jgi:hypothetical protein
MNIIELKIERSVPVRSGRMFVVNHRAGEEDTSAGDRQKGWKHNHLHFLFDVSADPECQLLRMPRSSSVIAMQLIFYPVKPLSVFFVSASSALSPTIGHVRIILDMRDKYTPHAVPSFCLTRHLSPCPAHPVLEPPLLPSISSLPSFEPFGSCAHPSSPSLTSAFVSLSGCSH